MRGALLVAGTTSDAGKSVLVAGICRWLHRRGTATPGAPLVAALAALDAPEGPVAVFAHGERGAMKEARAIVQDAWGLDRAALSVSAYWALGRAEDRFQEEKREPIGAIFTE